jgi:hypothetical protein
MLIRLSQVLLVCLVFSPCAVAQRPATRINDSSDWWSWVRQEEEPPGEPVKSQKREPAESNFRIAGVTFGTFREFKSIQSSFGLTTEVARGDGAATRHQICYASPSGDFHFILEYGEIAAVVYLFEGGSKWNGEKRCRRSAQVSRNLTTASGLRLGLSPEQVENILGKANVVLPDKLVYDFEFRNKTSAKGLAQLRRDYPKMTEETFHENFDVMDVSAHIEARFVAGKLNYIAIERSETY